MRIRTKLFLTVLALAVPALIVVGALSYHGGKAAVEKTTLDHLTSVRASKANQIEHYFDQIRRQARTLARDRMIIDAMIDFDDAHQELQDAEVAGEVREAVAAHYREEFQPLLEDSTDSGIDAAAYLPVDHADLFLQYQYINVYAST